MVMKPEPIVRALETVLSRPPGWSLSVQAPSSPLPDWNPDVPVSLPTELPVILLSPQRATADPRHRRRAGTGSRRIALICGRYEGSTSGCASSWRRTGSASALRDQWR
jgi:tRNA (guanine37-N1)-methyltransferase